MPPSADTVVRVAPALLAGLLVPISALAASSFKDRTTETEKHEKGKEATRRAKLVQEMIDILVRNEQAAAEVANESPQEEDEAEQEEAAEDGAGAKDAQPTSTSSSALLKGDVSRKPSEITIDEDDFDDDDEDGQITYDDLTRRCMELAEISPGAPELKDGVEWSGKLLLKELRRATRKTEAQDDVKYSDGSKLDDLLMCPEDLDGVAQLAQHPVPPALRAEVQDAYCKGWWVRRKQKSKEFKKAMHMILLAKDALPWVVFSSVVSAASVSIGTVALHYRAEVLAALQRPRSSSAASAAAGAASRLAPAAGASRRAIMAMVLVELLAAATRALESQLRARSQDLMARSIQVRLFEALVSKDMTWWGSQKEPWANINKVMCLPGQVESALAAPRTLINRVSTISIQVALVRQKSSRMLYAMLAMHWAKFGLNELIGRLMGWMRRRSVRGLVMPSQDKFTWIYALNPEYIRMYQSFARGPTEALDLKKYLCGNNRQQELTGAVNSLLKPLVSVISQGCSVVEFTTLGSLVEEGSLDITQAETVMHYASGVAAEVESTYWDTMAIQDKLSPLAKAWDFVALPPKIVPMQGLVPEGRAKGHFVFEDVHFHYPGRRGKLLKGVSFEVKPGQVVGITGTTGCGKSTCLSLVERFYDVTKGRIVLDGRDIREYQPRWLRSQIVAVAQEPKLLPLTIRDNLTFGCDHDPSLDEIEQACRAANIWESLTDPQKFPNGLETQMRVVQNVAGGEKQRLCIARAILADPPILLLDEATSALDEVSQAQVQEALNKLMNGRTTLVIAHRLSTIKDSDKIIAMKDGRVADDGTHEELMQKEDGVWRQLWQQQGADMPATTQEEAPDRPVVGKTPRASSKKPPVTLQRTTTSSDGQFAVLRQAVKDLAEGDDEKARPVLSVVDELEERTSQVADIGVPEEIASKLPAVRRKNDRGQPTKANWAKIRALRRLGVFREMDRNAASPSSAARARKFMSEPPVGRAQTTQF